MTMKKTSKIVLAVIVVVMLGIGISTFFKVNGSIGSDKVQLRLAHGQAGDSEIGGTIAYLSDLVAEDDSMNMEVSVYPSGVLGSETAMVELVQAGVLDMAKVSANTLGQFDDRYTIFSLPYLFKGQDHYYSAMANSTAIRELFDATEDAGYIAIGYYCNGARNFYLKDDVAVTSPDVLKGKKIRSMVSSTSMDMIEAMGGSPVPMSSSETYTSLQQGIVDGAENTELALTVDKHEEIVKSYTYTEHQYTPDIYIISTKVWNKLTEMFKVEREKGVYDAETKLPQGIDVYGPGYIDKENEVIVGLQTDAPLKRGIFPKGGIRMVENSLEAYGYHLDPMTKEIFTKYRKTHNEGVFSAYTEEMIAARRSAIITGLPDAYGRGRIIGDYRRVALYGTAILIEEKKRFLNRLDIQEITEEIIQSREEISEQIKALKAFEKMCASYGFDVTRPAQNAREAVQFVYLAYLAAVKDQDGAAMSIGRTSTFLDIYIEKDIREGKLTEEEAQELVDQLIIKLRIVRFLRTPEYNDLFSGDPVWVTESLGGQGVDGRSLVTRTSYRYLHTLYNLGPAPEPNLTVLWFKNAPENWKRFCAKVSIDTSAIQYENDDLMRPDYGDDYGIACCVSPMKIGKQMQFFGARANLAKCLLYAINGGRDERSGVQVAPMFEPVRGEYLEYDEVMAKYEQMMRWLAKVYVNALKIIHYMHDKYAYEAFEMSLHDGDVERIRATGIAGLSIVADSLAAIRDTKVRVLRDERGLAVDFEREGEYVPFGNNDDRTDSIAVEITEKFMEYLRQHETYRHAKPTQSILTITSNVVYGKKTGTTPDGRIGGTPFAPGANPMNGRDTKGAIAALASVAKLPFQHAHDGISYTFAVSPATLGKEREVQINNLVSLLDGYFTPDGGQHLNVNVFDKDLLIDAMEHPEKYPQLTIRVSGYAVNFVKLTREQQLDVISRTINHSL